VKNHRAEYVVHIPLYVETFRIYFRTNTGNTQNEFSWFIGPSAIGALDWMVEKSGYLNEPPNSTLQMNYSVMDQFV
jgi:hypothetical protein